MANGRARVVLTDHKKKLEDRYIDILDDEGGVIASAMPPELWPDNVMSLLQAEDSTGAAAVILGGDEPYSRFVAAGGSAALLLSILKEETGLSVGE